MTGLSAFVCRDLFQFCYVLIRFQDQDRLFVEDSRGGDGHRLYLENTGIVCDLEITIAQGCRADYQPR